MLRIRLAYITFLIIRYTLTIPLGKLSYFFYNAHRQHKAYVVDDNSLIYKMLYRLNINCQRMRNHIACLSVDIQYLIAIPKHERKEYS